MKSKLIKIIISGIVSAVAIGASVGLVVYHHTNTSEPSELESEVSADVDADSKSNAEEKTKDTEQTVDIDPETLYNEVTEATKNVQSECIITSSNLDKDEKVVDDIIFERQTYIDVASGQEIIDTSDGAHEDCNLEEYYSTTAMDEISFCNRLDTFNTLTDIHLSKVKLNGNVRYKLEAHDTEYNSDYIYYIDPETKLVTNFHEIQPGNIIVYKTFEYNIPYSFGE